MMNTPSSKNDPDIIKVLFHWPLHILFFLFLLIFPFNEYWSEILIWLCSSLTLIYMLIRVFALRQKANVFRLGGDISLLVFLGAILIGWQNEGALNLNQLFHIRWFIFIYVLSYFFDLLPNLNTRFNFLLLSIFALAAIGILQALSPQTLQSFLSTPTAYRSPGSVFPWIPQAAMGFFQSPFHFGIIITMGLSIPLSILFFHLSLGKNAKLCLWIICAFFIFAAALTFDHVVYIAVTLVFSAQFLIKRKITWLAVTGLIAASLFYFGSDSPFAHIDSANNQAELQSTLQLFQTKVFWGHGLDLETGSLQQEQATNNTYFQLLAATGVVGFAGFLVFSLQLLFIILRLWQEIPPSHFWHRSYLAAAIGIQTIFHFAGLRTWSLGQHTMICFFFFSIIVVAVLSERYSNTLVSDDYSV